MQKYTPSQEENIQTVSKSMPNTEDAQYGTDNEYTNNERTNIDGEPPAQMPKASSSDK